MNTKYCVVLLSCLQMIAIACNTNPARSNSPATTPPSATPPSATSNQLTALTPPSTPTSTESVDSDSRPPEDSAPKNASPSGNKEACALITNADIATVQGEAVKDAKATSLINRGFNISQCFYTLPTFVKSVSFEITRGAANAKDQKELHELWESKFGQDAGKKNKDREEEEETENEGHRPEHVSDVGREAFWIAGRSGALYVLTNKNAYLRISIGGNESDQTKITKAKTLAQFAIKRL